MSRSRRFRAKLKRDPEYARTVLRSVGLRMGGSGAFVSRHDPHMGPVGYGVDYADPTPPSEAEIARHEQLHGLDRFDGLN